MHKYFLVMLGGAIGSLMRYVMATAITARFDTQFPIGTFAVNVAGSFAMGVLMASFTHGYLPDYWRLPLGVGFLGGFTTFSALEYEMYLAVKGSSWFAAWFYAGTSVICGFLAVFAGAALVRR